MRAPAARSTPPSLGIGLGLRRAHFAALLQSLPPEIQWFEVAPENYLDIGGRIHRDFCELAERLPLVAHSVSLSLGSLDPLDRSFLKKLKGFIRQHQISLASDHICFSSYHGVQFDDLLPLPFTEEAVRHTASKIRRVQELLEVPFAVENISYYAPSGAPEMSEAEFVRAVIKESGAWLLLDVNNVYVNSINHRFDAHDYLRQLPLERIAYVHVAGHIKKRKNFLLDTHGAAVIDPVWQLLRDLAGLTAIPSLMIERDHNIPAVEELVEELKVARAILGQEVLRVAL